MTYLQIFLISATISFAFLSVIWSGTGMLNLSLKLIFIANAVAGLLFTLYSFGFVVKG